MEENIHTPVLVEEVLTILNPQIGENAIDATINGGGHARVILDRIGAKGRLLGIDRDAQLIEKLKKEFAKSPHVTLICDNYAHIAIIAREYGLNTVDIIMFDLGFSSYHVDKSGRGFSFLRDEPLDMRYNPTTTTLTAAMIVNKWPKDALTRIFREYGQERFAPSLAAAIIRERAIKRIYTTHELVQIVKKNIPVRFLQRKTHPATRIFQALRMEVNDELGHLRNGLDNAIKCLGINGRLAVISFHSLEDRIVKEIFRTQVKGGNVRILIPKPLMANSKELKDNPRSRSAKLRGLVKII